MGLKQEVDALYNALLNGPAVTLTRYPAGVVGSALTGAGAAVGAYDLAAAGANQVQTIAAGANTVGMWVAGGHLQNPSVVVSEDLVLWIGRGTIPNAVLLAELQMETEQDSAVGKMCFPTMMLPIPLFVQNGVGIALDLANSTAGNVTANGSLFIYEGLGV